MSLTRPLLLWLLVLVLPLLGLERWRLSRVLPALRAIWGDAVAASWKFRRALAAGLRALAAVAAVIAFSGPVMGMKATRTWTSGLDVAILMDVSNSMNVIESGATRLERAKREARGLMDRLPDGRFALVVFKGSAATIFPLTDDSGSIDEFLDSAGSHLLTAKGSDIAAGVDEALKALRTRSGSARAIVLLSDGEALAGDTARAAEASRAAGAPIYAIGLGSDEGGTVPERGNAVSKRERSVLRQVCQASGGLYADGENRGAVVALYDTLAAPLSPRGGRSALLERVDASAPFAFLAALALCLAALAGALPPARGGRAGKGATGGKKARSAKTALAAGSIALCAFLCGCDRASSVISTADGVMLASRGDHPRAIERLLAVLPRVSGADADTVRYDLGICYAAMGEQEAALDIMRRAANSADSGLAARAWYSLGCFHFMQAEYRQAWEAFRESLRREPGSRDAQVNLELSWIRMERSGAASSEESVSSSRKEGVKGDQEEFELIRQAERDRFRNAQETEAESDAKDY